MRIIIKPIECKRCGHRWVPRKTEVRQCPQCKSVWFDNERGPSGSTNNKTKAADVRVSAL